MELVRFPQLDKRLRPRRSLARPHDKPVHADQILLELRDRYLKLREAWRRGVEHGADDFSAEMIALADAADAMLVSAKLSAELPLEVCAAAEAMLGHRYRTEASLVRVVAAQRGVAATVVMKARSVLVGAVNARGWGSSWKSGLARHPDDHIVAFDDSWEALRDIVTGADDAAYREAVEAASGAREGAPRRVRILIDFAFPDEPAWANEDLRVAIAEPGIGERLYHVAPLLASIDDPSVAAGFVALAEGYQIAGGAEYAADLAVGLPADGAVDVLCTYLDKCTKSKAPGTVATASVAVALAAFPREKSAEKLATMLVHAQVGPIAVAYMKRFPELASSVLSSVAKGTTKNADAARALLGTVAAKTAPVGPVASRDSLPSLLRDPPWKKKAPPPPPPLALATLPFAERAVWGEGERKSMLDLAQRYCADAPEATAEEVAALLAFPESQRVVDYWAQWANGARVNRRIPRGVGLEMWNTTPEARTRAPVETMLAYFGDEGIPGLLARDAFKQNDAPLFRSQLHVLSPRTATLAARAIARRKAWKKAAYEWLGAHAEVAAIGLIPAALGARDKEQAEAEAALLWLARECPDIVRKVAAQYGADAAHALELLMSRDPLAQLTVRGKLPDYLDLTALPPLILRGGAAIDGNALALVVDIIRSTDVDPPYAGIQILREAFEPGSLSAVAWALTESWALGGAKAIHAWMPLSLAHFGDDDAARKLAPYVREWGRKDAKKCATAIAILVAIGTDTALLHLGALAERSRFEAVRTAAESALVEVARERGLTLDELRDRTVPDLDLEPNGKATLDYGTRSFIVSFDEALRPVLSDVEGQRLPQLPRGTRTDDPDKVKEAAARWKALKADSDAVRGALVARFEDAMCSARVITAAAWRSHVAGHPLVRHVARRLVWSAGDRATFRITEDGTLADEKDVTYTLTDDAPVTVAHVFSMSPESRAAWSQIFADYEIIQPFEQLGRATFTLTDDETSANTLARFSGRTAKPGALLGGLDARGWSRAVDVTLSGFSKVLATRDGKDARAFLNVSPGIPLDDVANAELQTLGDLTLEGTLTFSAMRPLDLSELCRDLESIAR